jgi:hypothetical protein
MPALIRYVTLKNLRRQNDKYGFVNLASHIYDNRKCVMLTNVFIILTNMFIFDQPRLVVIHDEPWFDQS